MNFVEVGANIKKYRKGKMTQAQLGEKIGKTESSIRKYEKGLVEIPWNVLEQIAKHLNVNVIELCDESVDKRPTEEILDDIYSTHLISDLKKLNIKGKEEAVKQVKILTKVPEYQLDHVIGTVSKAIQDGHISFVKKKDEE